ncbi:hypothetical protein BDV09DRAFT_173109 [Aspergillus tetrazonus]
MPTIPARRFAVQRLHIGQSIKVINSSGGQVIDTWAFSIPSTPSFPRYMSMTHTQSTLQKLLPSIHESSSTRNAILFSQLLKIPFLAYMPFSTLCALQNVISPQVVHAR